MNDAWAERIDGWTEQKNLKIKRNRALDNLYEAQLRAQLSLYLDVARLVETFIGRKAQCTVGNHINLLVGRKVGGLKQRNGSDVSEADRAAQFGRHYAFKDMQSAQLFLVRRHQGIMEWASR